MTTRKVFDLSAQYAKSKESALETIALDGNSIALNFPPLAKQSSHQGSFINPLDERAQQQLNKKSEVSTLSKTPPHHNYTLGASSGQNNATDSQLMMQIS